MNGAFLREPQIWGEIWSSAVAFLPCSLCRLLPTLMVSPAHELENSYSAVEKHFSLPDFLGVFGCCFFVFFGIFITFTCFRSSILVFTFSFHFNPYTVSQGDASLDQGGNHCWPKTTRRPVSHFAKKHLEIFCELTRQKLNFLEGFSPATSDIKLTQHFMKITTYQQSNSVV